MSALVELAEERKVASVVGSGGANENVSRQEVT